MIDKKEKYFLIFFILLIYIFNSGSIAQIDVYFNYYLPLANSIVDKFSYSINDNSIAYPMWGYSILLVIVNILGSYSFIVGFQLILCYFSILSLYRTFNLKFSRFHLILLLPIISLSTVKWNDAIVCSLLIFHIEYIYKAYEYKKLKFYIVSGIFLGLIVNFRSEYWLLIPLQILFSFGIKSVRTNVSFIRQCVIYLTTFLMILPWSIRNKIEFDTFKLTSSNGASVMYISLGQLPNNKWGIEAYDETSFKLVKKSGVKDPYSLEGEKILRSEFLNLIKNEPLEYLKKCLNNGLNILIGGVYTGEYGSLLIPKNERLKIDKKINSSKGLDKFKIILKQDIEARYLILLEKLILILYRILWLSLIAYFIYLCFLRKWDNLLIVVLILVIFKVVTVAAIQYEYRHINSIYPFVLGIVLRNSVKKV